MIQAKDAVSHFFEADIAEAGGFYVSWVRDWIWICDRFIVVSRAVAPTWSVFGHLPIMPSSRI